MALGFTQPLTEMITRNLPGVKVRPVLKVDNPTAICEPIAYTLKKSKAIPVTGRGGL
jgi:hypothetical protein